MSTIPTTNSVASVPRIARTGREYHRRFRRGLLATVAVLSASVVLGAGTASAAPGGLLGPNDAKETRENHCIAPSGVDLNEFYGVSEQIVTPFCSQVGSGERWTVSAPWFMAHTFAVAPAGFVPAGATPLEDFMAKFVSVKYVIDPGTVQETTYVFSNNGNLWTGTSLGGLPLVNSLTLGLLMPRSVGEHVVEVYWVFSAMHCDGIGDVIAPYLEGGNCLAAGENRLFSPHITVTPGAAQN
jgi:hypothetical protein